MSRTRKQLPPIQFRNIRSRRNHRLCEAAVDELLENGENPSPRLVALSNSKGEKQPSSYDDINVSAFGHSQYLDLRPGRLVQIFVKGFGAFEVIAEDLHSVLNGCGVASFRTRIHGKDIGFSRSESNCWQMHGRNRLNFSENQILDSLYLVYPVNDGG